MAAGADKEEPEKTKKKKHDDELLDEALEDSFPASDPPAQTIPDASEEPPPDKAKDAPQPRSS